MTPTRLAKSLLIIGLAAWMSIAVLNNTTDPATNRFFLGTMLQMNLLFDEPNGLGQGLLWRAMSGEIGKPMLLAIAAAQAAIAAYLWFAGISFLVAAGRGDARRLAAARGRAVHALSAFMALWLFFLVGGLWFGYWIKQGVIQQVHMTLLILSVLAIQFVGNAAIEEQPQ